MKYLFNFYLLSLRATDVSIDAANVGIRDVLVAQRVVVYVIMSIVGVYVIPAMIYANRFCNIFAL